MITLPELNSECFIYEKYESCFTELLDIPYISNSDNELRIALKKYAIGWCDAQRLQVRPRYGFVAIMCEKDGIQFWFHVTRKTFDQLFNTEYKENCGFV